MEIHTPLLLLIEDDPNDEELARIAIAESDILCRIDIKRDGAEVLDWLANLDGASQTSFPSVIFLDLKLPKLDGLEVLRVLRADERTKMLPIVVFTSSLELRDLEHSYESGANAYVRKPIDFTDYRQTISDMARFWLLRNHIPVSKLGL